MVKNFRHLKEESDKLEIPVMRSGLFIARLVVISPHDLNDPSAISLLSKWRVENSHWFTAQFPVTDAKTRVWLKKSVLDNDDRIIFWIQSLSGERWGHIGLAKINEDEKSCDIDSVMNGRNPNAPRGIMTDATLALMRWSFEKLDARALELEVLGDNLKAIALYLRCGFSVTSSVPLRQVDNSEGSHWERAPELIKAKRYFIRMRIERPL